MRSLDERMRRIKCCECMLIFEVRLHDNGMAFIYSDRSAEKRPCSWPLAGNLRVATHHGNMNGSICVRPSEHPQVAYLPVMSLTHDGSHHSPPLATPVRGRRGPSFLPFTRTRAIVIAIGRIRQTRARGAPQRRVSYGRA